MDKDKLKGKLKDLGGRLERQAGEWTGDKDAQSEGAAKQVEGKVQHAFGQAKDAARDVARDIRDRNRAKEPKEDITVEKTEKEVRVKRPRKAA